MGGLGGNYLTVIELAIAFIPLIQKSLRMKKEAHI